MRIVADFKTHIATSSAVGLGYGALIHTEWQIPLTTSIISGALCGLAGMLPDMDSDTGNAQREIMTFTAAIMPMLMIERFALVGLTPEQMAIATACVYIIVRFGFGEILRRYTVHRGMFHSIPAAVIAGLVTSIVCSCDIFVLKLVKAVAVSLGYLVHLILDEVWSVDARRVRLKKSFGTALKMFSPRWFPNVFTYGLLLFVGVLAYEDTVYMLNAHDHIAETQQGSEPELIEPQTLPPLHHNHDHDFNFGLQGEAAIGNGGF